MATEMNMEPSGGEGPVVAAPKIPGQPTPDYNMMPNSENNGAGMNPEFDMIKYCYEQKLFQYQNSDGYSDNWDKQKASYPGPGGDHQGVTSGNGAESYGNMGHNEYGQNQNTGQNPNTSITPKKEVHNNENKIEKTPETKKSRPAPVADRHALHPQAAQPVDAGSDDLAPPDMLNCGICGKLFTQKISLTIHMRSHTGEKPFQCETCGERFADNLILKAHKRTHIGERPYICTKCGKCFSQKSTLIGHEKVHTGEQLHTCEFCGREFLEQSSLTKHARMHENNAMYNLMKNKSKGGGSSGGQSADGDFDPVKYCYEQNLFPGMPGGDSQAKTGDGETGTTGGSKSPGQSSSEPPRKRSKPIEDDAKKDSDRFEQKWKKLKPENKRHANDGAEKNSEFIEHWNKQLSRSEMAADHSNMNMSTSDQNNKSGNSGGAQNDTPGGIVSGSGLSMQHLNPYRCEVCDKRFSQKNHLASHMQVHVTPAEKPHECDICGLRFADSLVLNAHKSTHTGDRPFVCTTCGKCFSQRSTLSVHQKVHTGEGLYTCQFCGKDFLKKYNLNKHLKVHSGEKAPKGPKPKNKGDTDQQKTPTKPPTSGTGTPQTPGTPQPGTPRPGMPGTSVPGMPGLGVPGAGMMTNAGQATPVMAAAAAAAAAAGQMAAGQKTGAGKPGGGDEFDVIKYCYEQKLFPNPDAAGGLTKFQPLNGETNENGSDKPSDSAADNNETPKPIKKRNPDDQNKDAAAGVGATGNKFDIKAAFPGTYDSLGRFSHIYGSEGLALPFPDTKAYKCEMCDEQFTTQILLTTHMQGHTGDRPLDCDICGQTFADKLILRSHKRVHAARKPFMCSICGEGFSQFQEFNVHQMSHRMAGHSNGGAAITTTPIKTPDNNDQASDNNEQQPSEAAKPAEPQSKSTFYPGVYGRPGALTYNAGKIDKKESNPLFPDIARPFKCEICDRRFAQKISLTVHLRGHTGEKPFECETCGKRFADNLILKAHKRTHTGERPFVCMTCGKGFSQRSTLSVHLKSHTGEKLHACEYCGKEFSKKSALTKHLRIHTGEKPYECHVCKRLFTQDYSLTVHLRLHSGEKPFQCHVCEKKFTTNTNLRRHMVVHKDVLGATNPDGTPLGSSLASTGSDPGKVFPVLSLDNLEKAAKGEIGSPPGAGGLGAGLLGAAGLGMPGLDLSMAGVGERGEAGAESKSGESGPESRPGKGSKNKDKSESHESGVGEQQTGIPSFKGTGSRSIYSGLGPGFQAWAPGPEFKTAPLAPHLWARAIGQETSIPSLPSMYLGLDRGQQNDSEESDSENRRERSENSRNQSETRMNQAENSNSESRMDESGVSNADYSKMDQNERYEPKQEPASDAGYPDHNQMTSEVMVKVEVDQNQG